MSIGRMSDQASVQRQRQWKGVPAAERRRQRRSLLIEAAIAVYGQHGYRGATVKSVCEAAGLSERYFYESFANGEAMLAASAEAVMAFLIGELRQAALADVPPPLRVRAMLRSYFDTLRRHPASARVFLVEIRGVSASVDEVFARELDRVAGLIVETWEAEAGVDSLLAIGVVGAVMQVALAWIGGGYARPLEEVTDAAFHLSAVLNPTVLTGERSTRIA